MFCRPPVAKSGARPGDLAFANWTKGQARHRLWTVPWEQVEPPKIGRDQCPQLASAQNDAQHRGLVEPAFVVGCLRT